MKYPHTLSTRVALIVSSLAAPAGTVLLVERDFHVLTAVVISLCGGTLLAGMLVLGSDKRLQDLERALEAVPAFVVAIIIGLWGLHLIYSLATNTTGVRPLMVMAVYLS